MLPALFAGRSGVHMKALQFVIVDDLEDMGMAADEKPGWVGPEVL